ncbi:MAG: hypothetical protein JRL30_26525 [Deltaproteobacteria bacterium]|nr:hypothetical protein [Deltaproteobacteria bacterium]
MKSRYKILLLIDAIVNLILGVLLLLFPVGVIDILGLPPTNTYFYPVILGAVILGIGLALLLEVMGYEKNIRGLGLGGAIAINLVGSLVLIFWLIFASLDMPLRGWIILWMVGGLVFLIGVAELITKSWTYDSEETS